MYDRERIDYRFQTLDSDHMAKCAELTRLVREAVAAAIEERTGGYKFGAVKRHMMALDALIQATEASNVIQPSPATSET
jgi:hypothetical protein